MSSEKRIADVEQIFMAGNTEVKNKADLARVVEEPCLALCEDLYDKNILTYWSSCNQTAPDRAYVLVRYDSLDKRNKAIADRLIEEGKLSIDSGLDSCNTDKAYGKGIRLEVKTSSESLVSDVSEQLLALAREFKHQDILYNVYSAEYIESRGWDGDKDVFGYPSLEVAVMGEKLSSDYQPWRKPIFEALSAIPPRNEDGTVDMEAVAGKLGWLYDEKSGKAYKDAETLRRHNEYLRASNQGNSLLNAVATARGEK